MMNIAVSNCLLGARCRFDASSKTYPGLIELLGEHVAVPICPEEEGGLGCPRPPSEIDVAHGEDRVFNAEGVDVTCEFQKGSRLCVKRAVEAGCTLAVLKSKSPACGVGEVYDGTFSGTLVRGFGMAARAFCAAGIRVIDEKSFVRCLRASRSLREGVPPLVSERSEQRPVLHGQGADLIPLPSRDYALLCGEISRSSLFATCWPTGSSVRRVHAFGVRSAAFRASMSGAVALGFDASSARGDECMLRMHFSASVSHESVYSTGIEAPLPKRFFSTNLSRSCCIALGSSDWTSAIFAQAPLRAGAGRAPVLCGALALGFFDGGFDLLPLCNEHLFVYNANRCSNGWHRLTSFRRTAASL